MIIFRPLVSLPSGGKKAIEVKKLIYEEKNKMLNGKREKFRRMLLIAPTMEWSLSSSELN